jgi:hypothetical protein
LRPRIILLGTALTALVASTIAFAAADGGGKSVASAPALNPGHRVTGGGQMVDSAGKPNSGAEYWRVAIPAGGVFIADYGSLNGRYVNIRLYRPSETDFTISNASYLTADGTDGRDEMRYRAGISGSYIFQIYGDCYQCDYGYELTSHILAKSTVTLTGPKAIVANRQGTVRGRVYGATGGYVSIQQRLGGGWRQITTTSLGPSGGFKAQIQFPGSCRRGSWSTRAVYAGDREHPAGTSNVLITRPGGC